MAKEVLNEVRGFVEHYPQGKERLAVKLGVSSSSISRWLSGQSVPQPKNEGNILRILADLKGEDQTLESISIEQNNEQDNFNLSLQKIREALHRSGRFSSRNEAIDEITKILFAHAVDENDRGLCHILEKPENERAELLKNSVKKAYTSHLPRRLASRHEDHGFTLNINSNENKLAQDILLALDGISDPEVRKKFRGMDGVDFLNDVFGQFLSQAFHDEKEFGQYLTPSAVVSFMTDLAFSSLTAEDMNSLCDANKCKDFGYILDPSCGVGSFLVESLKKLYKNTKEDKDTQNTQKWLQTILEHSIVGIDKSDRMLHLSFTNLCLFGAVHFNLHSANALLKSGEDGILTKSLDGKAKIILTNPPFGAEFESSNLEKYKLFNKWAPNKPKKINSELLFFERYVDWLQPGGILVSIVPDSILFNKGLYQHLRDGISSDVEILSCISLPAVTFAAAGTNTKTSILHLRKKNVDCDTERSTYFATCKNIGYSVSSKGSQRQKNHNNESDLFDILLEATGKKDTKIGKFRSIDLKKDRWDANYYTAIPLDIEKRLGSKKNTTLKSVVDLTFDKVDPRRAKESTFKYIEISNVNPETNDVSFKEVVSEDAASRARKKVKSGDILVSTVRPERRVVGVVPEFLDGAVCSTGFAVLRPKNRNYNSLALAKFIQTDFCTYQVLRHNVGISYPTIYEDCLLGVEIPASSTDIKLISESAEEVSRLQKALLQAQEKMTEKLSLVIDSI